MQKEAIIALLRFCMLSFRFWKALNGFGHSKLPSSKGIAGDTSHAILFFYDYSLTPEERVRKAPSCPQDGLQEARAPPKKGKDDTKWAPFRQKKGKMTPTRHLQVNVA